MGNAANPLPSFLLTDARTLWLHTPDHLRTHPCAQGKRNPVLSHPAVVSIAQRLGRTPGQVVLRWALQHGQVRAYHFGFGCVYLIDLVCP